MGGSQSTSTSEQSAQAYLSQQFYGSCNISCTNIQSGINIDIINSVIGGDINLTQKCSVDANCMVSNVADATTDVLFKAANSSNAKNAANLFSGDILNFDSATSASRQDIKQTILQSTTETCKMASLNQMTNVNILAANSRIGGSINLSQDGSTQGTCQLGNNFTAAAAATAMANNSAASGKDKKGQKKGASTGLITILVIVGVGVVIYIIARMYNGNATKNEETSLLKQVAQARAEAGCPGGLAAMKDKAGNFIIDPTTNRPVCPPQK